MYMGRDKDKINNSVSEDDLPEPKTPEELVLPEDDVEEIGDNRYLISIDSEGSDSTSPDADTEHIQHSQRQQQDGEQVLQPNTDESTNSQSHTSDNSQYVEDTDKQYVIDITVKNGERVDTLQTSSNDVRTAFEDMLFWYAQQMDTDEENPEEVIELLLQASRFDFDTDTL